MSETKPVNCRPDFPAWAIAVLAILAVLAALVVPDALAAQSTCPPNILPECAKDLPCPYPEARVTPSHQQAIIAKGGPWHLSAKAGEPLPGMQRVYATAEDWRRDAWGRPADFVYDKHYCRSPAPCGITFENAATTVLKVIKSNVEGGACVSHTGNHAMAKEAWTYVYGRHPTLGQWVELECRKDLGGHWVVDAALEQAKRCDQRGGQPPPEPQPPPVPVPQPPPPEPPTCTPYEGSACEEQCKAGHARGWRPWDREWCLSPERAGSVVGAKCAPVCRGEEPEPPPLPPAEDCALVRITHRGDFTPGAPSTGALDVEVLPCRGEFVVEICRGGTWGEMGVVEALPGEWITVELSPGTCGVRFRAVEGGGS